MKNVVEELFAKSGSVETADTVLGGILANLYSFYTAW